MAEIRDGRTYYGRVWVEGEYREPVYPSALNVRVGEPGVKVVDVLRYLRAYDNDINAVVKTWDGFLARRDVEDAVSFYRSSAADREEIDARLAEEAAPA